MSHVLLMGDPRVTSTPVVDCGEDLVDLRTVDGLALVGLKAGESASYMYLRMSVLERLGDAQAALPHDYRLLLIEGYRPYRLQRLYFDTYRAQLVAEAPDLADSESYLLASRYVSPPEVAPHVTGAAIDLTLTGPSGEELDLGTPINATPEDSQGACYFAAINITSEARQHRRVLAGDAQRLTLMSGRPRVTAGGEAATPAAEVTERGYRLMATSMLAK